ncbi:MAG: MBL fold metallo-hydrolase [Candidatus Omnitrophica bacterium]|jgi:ribonuclease J|nr:MBL fold metallo-hydrolase [Candidatus Omnitrophota bacterium]
MKLIIHRGTQEIGGSCVELATSRTRILLDFGLPLVSKSKEPFDSKILTGKSIAELKKLEILPDIKGLYKGEPKEIDALLISHSHPDHYGLLNYLHPDIPVYLSQGVKELIEISSDFTPIKVSAFNSRIINNETTFSIGDIKVTPYLVDHSAFDARAFLIEADGKRLFYSGDFRGHGRKSCLFNKIIKNPPQDVDCLLMEGTSLGRDDKGYPNELVVQKRIAEILRKADNITFLFVSSQNIDRIVSAYKACLETNSIFVIDVYTAYILERLSSISKGIPQFNWNNIRLKFHFRQGKILADKESLKTLYRYKTNKIDFKEINNSKQKILFLSRYNSLFPHILKKLKNYKGAKVIYSLWEGYLTAKFRDFCKENKLVIAKVHSSGHAKPEDLKRFAKALNPKVLIPIHTFYADRYRELFKRVKILKDKELFTL